MRAHRRHHHQHQPRSVRRPMWWVDLPRSFWVRIYERKRLRRRVFGWILVAMLSSVGLVHMGTRLFPQLMGWKFSLLVVLGSAWFVAGAISWRLAKPFDQIARVAESLGKGNLSSRVDLHSVPSGEPRVLGEVLNEMASRLEKQVSEQRALLAMVSHEVRTPLARMRLLLENVAADDAAKRIRAHQALEREIHEMDDLIGQLLATTRIDFNRQERAPIDPIEIAVRALETARVAPEVLDADDDLGTFLGDPTLVLRALVNLLQNAEAHGRGVKAFQVRLAQGFVVFEVHDAGPGIAPMDLERIFEPFVHGDTKAERRSVGLGLSLVRRIATAHQGTVVAENLTPQGARLILRLPRSPSTA